MESTRTLEFFNENVYLMDDSKKLELAKECKNEGVDLFKNKKFREAFIKFSKGIKYLVTIMSVIDGTNEQNPLENEKCQLLGILYNNLASCHVLKRNWEHAVDVATLVIEKDPKNLKALYRRGMSYIEIQEYDKAKIDLDNALELDPNNQAIKDQLIILIQKVRKFDKEFAVSMKKLFT